MVWIRAGQLLPKASSDFPIHILFQIPLRYTGASWNGGTPKSMVYHGKSQSNMDDDWGYPYDSGPYGAIYGVPCRAFTIQASSRPTSLGPATGLHREVHLASSG